MPKQTFCYKKFNGESWDSSCENLWVPVQNQWVPVKKTISPKLKMLGPLCNQTVYLKTDSKTHTTQYTEIKIQSFCFKAQCSKQKDIFFVKQQPQWLPQKLHEQAGHFDRNTCSDWLIDLCVIWDACHGLFCIFTDFLCQGCRTPRKKHHCL